jgi:hypothetical protein
MTAFLLHSGWVSFTCGVGVWFDGMAVFPLICNLSIIKEDDFGFEFEN